VVAFAGSAALVQPPTRSREEVLNAIEQLQLQNATAVGSGILVSLKAIFPEQDFEVKAPQLRAGMGSAAAGGSPRPLGAPPKPELRPVPPGSYKSAVVILLTDGQTTTGPDPVDAARLAAERGVRIFTVGVGTPDGQILTGEGWSIRVRLDEDALKVIADMTRAEYFFAGNAPDLKKIYEVPQLQAGDGEEGDRDHRALHEHRGGIRAAWCRALDAVVQPHSLVRPPVKAAGG